MKVAEQELGALEFRSIQIIKDAKVRFKNPAALWSTKENSVILLSLIKRAFNGKVPFPVIYLDNGLDFPESHKYVKDVARRWKLNLLVVKTEEKTKQSRIECCGKNKAKALSKFMEEKRFDGLIVPTRRESTTGAGSTLPQIRIRPMLDWSELDVWNYAKKERIPINPLYFSKNGYRCRRLGCTRCSEYVKSNARTIDDIIAELSAASAAGKGSDKTGKKPADGKAKMQEKLRALGYM